ncbi:'Cold-shock' DNA-binding domain-containing protein [Streptomyces sp. 2224.1]|nr:cold-shock-like DNA binding protein [Streptomyces sp. 2321.6]SDR38617.1 'Cold-shock' DNA-binding domain-containing protein [Streptomyces sp. KS_16]SEB93324.1 'Cold-shock' DNA-binding domain-containing protein [Streptomyces sp. 2224.1]SED09139.1 'Cold-shock' DNA-binding domain-containing protein [Streptomyces sp. 2133.1]SEE69002.1 'Cold-shock' DNA-binding domain-containing protein [Streptomyces sp. 2112.3]SNC69873.1 'Cold-shock' DNA-binding domain-containing protein [Streptomyces sp. 2114.4]
MPINGQIKRWAVTSAPAEHAEILGRWELFTNMRMLTALAAFGLLRRDEEGRGVLDSPETPGGCFGHFSDIQMTGFRTLAPGQQVDLTWEAPGFKQGGYDYRALAIVPRLA